MEEAVGEFLREKKLPETLRVFVNTYLGETWEDQGERIDDLGLYDRREDYTIPDEVVLLTAGVDVQLRKNLWDNVKILNKQGVTIILSTHYLTEAEEMCDRIGILNKGNLVALDTTKNLLKRIQTKIVRFAVDKKVNINNNSLKSINILSNETGELVVSYEKNALNIDEMIKFINDQNIKLLDISTDDGNLEDVFIRLTKN